MSTSSGCLVRSFIFYFKEPVFNMYHVLYVSRGDPIIPLLVFNLSLVEKFDEILSPGLVVIASEALWAVYHKKVSMAALFPLKNPDIQTVSTVISIRFWFLASYRPSFHNRGTVSGTQTGNFETYILI